jgi:hypothetical protein
MENKEKAENENAPVLMLDMPGKPKSGLKVVDWNKSLFPELTESLDKYGQIEDVLRDEDGITIDGVKREILLGREQVRFKVVPKGSACSNIHHLNKVQRQAVVKYKYDQLYKKYGSMEAKNTVAKLYGVSLRTIERDLDPHVATNVVTLKLDKKGRMYEDTKTWNPFVGCKFDCVYCKPSFQKNHYFLMQHQNCGFENPYTPHEHKNQLDMKKIPNERTIFVCGDSDIAFAKPEYMAKIFEVMKRDTKKDRLWFIQSKSPASIEKYIPMLPKNTILLTTLETNRDANYDFFSQAPKPSLRYEQFKHLDYPQKIVTIEPIMDFDLEIFTDWIVSINPLAVFIGYNSHPMPVALPEPDMEKTLDLIVALKNKGIRVLTKHLWKMAYRDFAEKVQENNKVN